MTATRTRAVVLPEIRTPSLEDLVPRGAAIREQGVVSMFER
jgi:hypothetical protein